MNTTHTHLTVTVAPADLSKAQHLIREAGATIVLSSPVREGYRLVVAEAAPEAVAMSPSSSRP